MWVLDTPTCVLDTPTRAVVWFGKDYTAMERAAKAVRMLQVFFSSSLLSLQFLGGP